jgi:hypothetical protein
MGLLALGILWVGPRMADRVIDNHTASINQLVGNNREQREAAVAVIEGEREGCSRQLALERAWMSDQLQRDRALYEGQFKTIIDRLERALKER